MNRILAPAILFLTLLNAIPTSAQRTNGKGDSRVVFDDVQKGISSANVSLFSTHFSSQVHITLRGGGSGLYSSSQAYYLLHNYFRDRTPAEFSFSTFGESETNPYATGRAAFTARGRREFAQIYVALAYNGDRWVITHINIY
jgi:hypothetical protein